MGCYKGFSYERKHCDPADFVITDGGHVLLFPGSLLHEFGGFFLVLHFL